MKNRIREARKAAKITQEELSRAVGITHATLSRYESGTIDPPSSKIEAIANALGVSVGYLLGYTTEKIILPDRLKITEIQDPNSGFVRYDIDAVDPKAFDYGLQILERAGVSVPAQTPQALVLADMDKLNYDGQQKAVERVRELTEIPRYQAQRPSRAAAPAPEGKDTTPAQKPSEAPQEGVEGPSEGE